MLMTSFHSLADDWGIHNQRLIEEQIIPAYQALQKSSLAFKQHSYAFCAKPNDTSLDTLRSQWRLVMNDWMEAQILRFGPVEDFMRYYRLQMWPDKRNTGGRQLSKALLNANIADLAPGVFRHSSVALQGLGASERLLFSDYVNVDSFTGSEKNKYRCSLQVAIADSVSLISQALLNDWVGNNSYKTLVLQSGKTDQSLFESQKEVASYFLNNFLTQLQSITDQKLSAPLGDGLTKAKGRKAESWRSLHSLENIHHNLLAMSQWYRLAFSEQVEDETLNKQIKSLFDDAIRQTKHINQPLSIAVKHPDERKQVNILLNQINQLKTMVSNQLTTAVGLSIGFNSLDGD